MEDNRFKRAYQEYQREKEALRNNTGRFECLRSDNYVCYSQGRDFNRFSEKNDTIYLPRETFGRKPVELAKPVEPVLAPPVVYLPRPTPKVETQVVGVVEPWRHRSAVQRPAVTPVVTFDSNYHFPELLKGNPNKNIIIPESKKEMITKTVIIPIQKPTMTLLSFENGKVRQREVFEDGTEVPETGIVIIKKPNYSSWASVLKPETTETIYYDLDDKKIIDVS